MVKPLSEGDSVLAACVFKPGEQPICLTLRAFDEIKKKFEKGETETTLKIQP